MPLIRAAALSRASLRGRNPSQQRCVSDREREGFASWEMDYRTGSLTVGSLARIIEHFLVFLKRTALYEVSN